MFVCLFFGAHFGHVFIDPLPFSKPRGLVSVLGIQGVGEAMYRRSDWVIVIF